MRRRWKLLIAGVGLLAAGELILATALNEAYHIKRSFPDARVFPSHRFGPVFSPWDFASFVVPGDFISPIDHADVSIESASEPVDIAKLLEFRVSYVRIIDCEIVNFDALLRDEDINISIMMSNPTFLDASPEELKNLEEDKVMNDVTMEEEYWFGHV
jgi:hypothetical protein